MIGPFVPPMGKVLDLLEKALEAIASNRVLITNESFVMNIFKDLMDDLPSFSEYWEHMFDKKRMSLIDKKAGSEVPFAKLREELFAPTDDTNKATTDLAIELGVVAAKAILSELRDKNKATAQHLSSVDGRAVFMEEYIREGPQSRAENDGCQ